MLGCDGDDSGSNEKVVVMITSVVVSVLQGALRETVVARIVSF